MGIKRYNCAALLDFPNVGMDQILKVKQVISQCKCIHCASSIGHHCCHWPLREICFKARHSSWRFGMTSPYLILPTIFWLVSCQWPQHHTFMNHGQRWGRGWRLMAYKACLIVVLCFASSISFLWAFTGPKHSRQKPLTVRWQQTSDGGEREAAVSWSSREIWQL